MIVCSKSTKKYFPNEECFVISAAPTTETMKDTNKYDLVVAVGGGKVIDTAKIIAKETICYPTTAAGACMTTRSGYWDYRTKKSVMVFPVKTVHLVKEFIDDVPEKYMWETYCDAISHCLDVKWSRFKTKESIFFADKSLEMLKGELAKVELVAAGNLAGQAIELCSTNILHSLSYPLTAWHNVSHGKAMEFFLPMICEYMNFDISPFKIEQIDLPETDFSNMIDKAMEYYPKIFDTIIKIDFENLKKKCLEITRRS